jgi:3-oxoacyl-[acyl-carrier-protein] synthase-3
MSRIRAAISGVYGYVPDYVLTNEELEKMVETSNDWIFTRTGIRERRILRNKDMAASDMGAEIVKGLLRKTGTSPEEVELLICGTITGDKVFPDTANTICDKVGLKNAFGFDLNAACSGFLYSLVTGVRFIESGAQKKVIVLGMDVMSSIIDYSDRTTCVIFGDGGGAVMLEPAENEFGIEDSILRANGEGRHFLYMKSGGSQRPPTLDTVIQREHFVIQDGRPVFKAAVTGMTQTVTELLDRNGVSPEEVAWMIPHQANIRIIKSVAEHLNFPMERVTINIQKYGNTTAGTLPLCLWEWEDQFRKGDKIILTAFGGGFTWGACLISWAYDSKK